MKTSYSSTDSTLDKRTLIIAAAVIISAGILMHFDLYRCPLDLFFGIPCPLCGATRAVTCALTGRFADAFYYHPLWPLFIISGIVVVLYGLGIIKVKQTVVRAAVCFFTVITVSTFIIRHVTASPVVAVHFERSLLLHILPELFGWKPV